MTNAEMIRRIAMLLPKNHTIMRVAGHDYQIVFKTELDKLCAVQNVRDGFIKNLNELFSYNVKNIWEVLPLKRFFLVTTNNEQPQYMIQTNGHIPATSDSEIIVDIGRSKVIELLCKGVKLQTDPPANPEGESK